MRRVLLGFALLVLLALGVGSAALAWAHWSIRREGAPLPAPEAVRAVGTSDAAGPVRAFWIATARQPMPRAAVLDARRDPEPDAAYVMTHPAFVLEWADGRILLVDAGMTREGARDFGAPLEMVAGAAPIEPLGSVAEQLGAERQRVAGVLFTHLHVDHVGGLPALCAGPLTVPVFLSEAQAERPNWTTRPGLEIVRSAPCASVVPLAGEGSLLAVPGFAGVAVFPAAGHTPGSQVILARVGTRRLALVGDLVNHADGIRHDVPKPFLYSLLVVPEATGRLAALRAWVRDLAGREGVEALPSHDEAALRASSLPPWPGAGAGT